MWQDPIVEDVRKSRDEYAKKLGYDLKVIWQDIKSQEAESVKKLVSLPARYARTVKV